MFPISNRSLIKWLEWSIVFISSVLLTIWAMQHTVALRNILLSLGCLISLIYIFTNKEIEIRKIPIQNLIPFFLIGALFVWVLTHYFFFSQDEVVQFKELRSIWLRSFLGVILGCTTGLIIARHPKRIYLLAIGITAGFIVLYSQYIPRVVATHQLLQVDYVNYIFYGKINGVLMGTLLIAGLFGYVFDFIQPEQRPVKILQSMIAVILLMSLPLYVYVYLFSAKNGIGLAVILCIFLVALMLWGVLRKRGEDEKQSDISTIKTANKNKTMIFVVTFSLLVMCAGFAKIHIQKDPTWRYLIEDVAESVQIDKYPQWKSTQTLGSPTLASGRRITGNVFERVAWATAGIRLIPDNLWGNGILQYPFQRTLGLHFPKIDPQSLPGSTHSGWLELTLSFGLPALIFLWGALLSIFLGAIKNKGPNQGLVLSLTFGIFCLYTVGELSNNHAVEILLFSIALLAGINCLGRGPKGGENSSLILAAPENLGS
jgi:hypothetical protein